MVATLLATSGPAMCLRATAAIAAGAMPARADLADAPCVGNETAALRFERGANALRAGRDIAQDETIAAVPAAMLPDVRPGDPLYIVARVGTATVERAVVAAQPGRRGQPIFVRTPDGRLLSARLEGDE